MHSSIPFFVINYKYILTYMFLVQRKKTGKEYILILSSQGSTTMDDFYLLFFVSIFIS